MNTEVQAYDEFSKSMMEIEQTQKMVTALMRTPHYAKLGEVGVFTVVQKAKSIGLSPLDALNGGMYFVNGKVELSANTMNYMIRSKGHSITKDTRSTKDCCVLNGKRCDNGDTWSASFSIQEAKNAGIYKNTWEKYPDDMLFARALTRLGRQLFPDVLKGCYVEGEISSAMDAEWSDKKESSYNMKYSPPFIEQVKPPMIEQQKKPIISKEQFDVLDDLIGEDTEYRNKVLKHLLQMGIKSMDELPYDLYEKALSGARLNNDLNMKLIKEVKKEEVKGPSVFDAVVA